MLPGPNLSNENATSFSEKISFGMWEVRKPIIATILSIIGRIFLLHGDGMRLIGCRRRTGGHA